MQVYCRKNQTAVLHTFFEASKTVIAALASSDPATRRHAEAFREIGERCFKKWAPDFEMTEYCFRNQSIAYRQLQQ
jgi:hypothetical protein